MCRRLACLKALRELLKHVAVLEREIAELESTLAEPPRVGLRLGRQADISACELGCCNSASDVSSVVVIQ